MTIFLAAAAGAIGGLVSSGLDPISRQISYSLNYIFPNKILEPVEIIDLYRREFISKNSYYALFQVHGYDSNKAKLFFKSQDALLTPEQALVYRIEQQLLVEYNVQNKIVTSQEADSQNQLIENQYYDLMKRNGYREEQATRFFRAQRPIPTFSTLLDWQRHEVFEPEVAATFELSTPPPADLVRFFAAYGSPLAESQNYWTAHWREIGYALWSDTFHRLDSSRDDLDEATFADAGFTKEEIGITATQFTDYFDVLEYSPYFKKRLLATSYRPLNFTTLQQLYQYGILNDKQIIGRLRDINYSESSAKLVLATWSRKYPFAGREAPSNNTLLKQQRGEITRAESKAKLIEDGVSEVVAEYHSEITNDKIIELQRINTFKILAIRLGRGEITVDESNAIVDNLITEPTRRTLEKKYIEINMEKYFRRISPRQIARGLSEGKITANEATTALTTLRMPTEDQVLILKIYGTGEVDEDEDIPQEEE